jgi:hypothetical protein
MGMRIGEDNSFYKMAAKVGGTAMTWVDGRISGNKEKENMKTILKAAYPKMGMDNIENILTDGKNLNERTLRAISSKIDSLNIPTEVKTWFKNEVKKHDQKIEALANSKNWNQEDKQFALDLIREYSVRRPGNDKDGKFYDIELPAKKEAFFYHGMLSSDPENPIAKIFQHLVDVEAVRPNSPKRDIPIWTRASDDTVTTRYRDDGENWELK